MIISSTPSAFTNLSLFSNGINKQHKQSNKFSTISSSSGVFGSRDLYIATACNTTSTPFICPNL